MNCGRCDFRADDLTEHAFDTGHRLCIVCQRQSLTVHEPQTCPACVGAVRVDLADLVEAYTLLEPDGLIGLTLRGDGTMQRHAHRYELDGGIRDEWSSDPLPVIAALASWEDFWRADYGDPTAGEATLTGVVGYLTGNLDTGHRAAQTHPAFDEFAANVRQLRSAVRFAAGLSDVPVEAEAECFDCGGQLLRTFRPPVAPVQRRRKGLPAEGLTDEWTCGWCREVYDQARYFLALRARASQWVSVPLAAETSRRSIWTLRSWISRLQVTSACRIADRAMVVWWPDVSDRAFRHTDDAQSRGCA